ncbi:argininosuccinate lyase [Mesosutterella sp. AGMB02718]|uniref:Argininosuccinate lyase n=1 Tax=Mesosutterella faecium TaxID=2925194 RepID=A0ABT7IQ66_9BURK|nr:argininosuccinate lyase [Mesosutterella sp. AGMB02718]MDL2060530.1 argininosuccinate lyase [Mesosutterella sp. AGMB02718]
MAERIHRGKIKTPPDPLVVKYLITPGIENDIKYRYQAFLDCNKAHVLMLMRQKIVTREVASAILKCNRDMAAMGDKPDFPIDPNREDFYFNLEAHLIEQVGIEIGGQQHTARSRNDLYATCARLAVRNSYFEICRIFNRMRQAIIEVARANEDAVYAGYTHMQPSEPITFAHYCSAVLNGLQRDYRRIAHCYEGLNLCPLGGGSMGSTTWNIDRNYTSKMLGFDAPVDNSIDCVATRDFITDILAALSIAANTLSRFCQDLYVWATPDYGYIEVSDSCAVCSSIMPQKKNPWVLEHIKAKAAHVEGCFMSALNVMKNVIYSHCEDMCGESANYFFPALQEMKMMCELMEVSIRGITVKKERMLENAKGDFCTVTELANALVRKDGISFRMAHDIVAQVVAHMLETHKRADEIGTDVVNPIYMKLFNRTTGMTDEEIRAALDPVAIAYAKKCIGGTAPEEVERQLNNRQKALDQDNAELKERMDRVAAAKAALEQAVTEAIA